VTFVESVKAVSSIANTFDHSETDWRIWQTRLCMKLGSRKRKRILLLTTPWDTCRTTRSKKHKRM